MNITYNNKKYCISPCAKDKFQRFIINPLSWVVTFAGVILSICVALGILGLVFVNALFYGFDVDILLKSLFDFIIFGILVIVLLAGLYILYTVITEVYISISTRTITTGASAILFALAFIPIFLFITILLGTTEFLVFLLYGDEFVWLVEGGFGLSGLIANSFILGLFGYVGIIIISLIGTFVWNLKDIVMFIAYLIKGVNNKVNNMINSRYETKYKKECKLFVECA